MSKIGSVSYHEMYRDVIDWAKNLPRFDAIVAIGRSGFLPAAILATHTHALLVTVNDLLENRFDCPRSKLVKKVEKVLVLDDSVNSGYTMSIHRELLKNVPYKVSYAALYYVTGGLVDFCYKQIPYPRIFQWNFVHNPDVMAVAILDLDGVVCDNPKETNEDRYAAEIAEIKPLYIPSVPCKAFATCRIEKYRATTENWLHKYGINYGCLHMMNYSNHEERRKDNKYAEYKADIYGKSDALLFVESEKWQAVKIKSLTGKDVLCVEDFKML